jgi:ectoine hydroxylase-related dioxygenase (phytanoyl-CoA dioxygenase family)
MAWNQVSRPTAEQVAAFERDGIVCVRGVLSAGQLDRLRVEAERCLGADNPNLMAFGADRRILNSFFSWMHNPGLRAVLEDTNLPAMAARFLRSRTVTLYSDDLFVKEPGSDTHRTPWHADQPAWAVRGTQVLSLWVALDPVSMTTGAVEFVRGSHRWQVSADGAVAPGEPYRTMDELEAIGSRLDMIHFELEPGDMTVHHGMTIHTSGGNRSNATRRRGYAIRFVGDDVVYQPRHGVPGGSGLVAGQPLGSDKFPVVYRETDG